MTSRKPRQISDADRAARSARMMALNVSPITKAKQVAARSKWTPARRAQQAELIRKLNAHPDFNAGRSERRRWAKPVTFTIPEHVHPLVRGFFVEILEQRATMRLIADRGGVDYSTLRSWRKYMPRLDTIEAGGNSLGYELAWVPIGSRDENGFLKRKIKQKGVDR